MHGHTPSSPSSAGNPSVLPGLDAGGRPPGAASDAPMLAVKDLTRYYRQGNDRIEVLKELNFQAQRQETIAVVGKSGSGKSTLLSLLAGLDTPDSGEIIINGEAVHRMGEADLAGFRSRHLSIIFQQFHLFKHFNALENVMVPLWIHGRTDMARAREVLREVGLADRETHYPSQLSGGEKQRVAIARALINEPLLLLADEPSGNLDEETGQQILGLLFALVKRRGSTLVLVTHDDSAAAACDRRYRLLKGQLRPEHA